MKYSHVDQVHFARIVLALYDIKPNDIPALQKAYDFGLLIQELSDANNGLIYDINELVFERIRVLKNDPLAVDEIPLRKKIIDDLASH